MDVTRHNQEAAFQDLNALLPYCEFYALDLEMTGIRATEKDLAARKDAVDAQKEANAKKAGIPYARSTGVTATIGGNPLLQHSQLQSPAESYDEKITAASTYNVIQMGISLFFKKGTTVPSAVGSLPLGNFNADDKAMQPQPRQDTDDDASTPKKHKYQKDLRSVPKVTLPLSAEGLKLWKAVDADFARTANGTTTDISKAVQAALTKVSDTIVNQSALIGNLSDDISVAKFDANSVAGVPLEQASEVTRKLNFFSLHAEAFKIFSDAVQIKGLLGLYEKSLSASPANPPKWKSFEYLFPMKQLDLGQIVKVPPPKERNDRNNNDATNATPNSAAAAANNGVNKFDANAPEYTTRSFSFYVFPHPHLDGRNMTLNSTTVGDFLAKNSQISFDKWIRNGVHYVNREKLLSIRNEKVLAHAKTLVGKTASSDDVLSEKQLQEKCPSCSSADITVLFKFLAMMNEYATKCKVATEAGKPLPAALAMPFVKADAFDIVKAELYKLGMEKQGKVVCLSTRPKREAGVNAGDNTVSQANAEYFQRENELVANWNKISENSGATATRVFELLVDCKKPIIVQNGWSDLAFLYCTFHQNTPLDLPAFKAAINALFPKVYDTRTLATLEPFNAFSSRGRLETIYRSFQQKFGYKANIYVPEHGQELFIQGDKGEAVGAHDASYDAFITGCLFIYEQMAMPNVKDIDKFANIIPCYGSIFSLKLDDMANDVWIAANPRSPILRITLAKASDFQRAPRTIYTSQTRIKSQLAKQHLPGLIQVPTDAEALYFVEQDAKSLGSLFDFSLSKAKADIERDIGFPITIEMMPAREMVERKESTVKAYWPTSIAWPTSQQ